MHIERVFLDDLIQVTAMSVQSWE